MAAPWWRRALSQRLTTLVGAALILWIVPTMIASSVATERIAGTILEQRRAIGVEIARRVQNTVTDTLRGLDRVAAAGMSRDPARLTAAIRGLALAESVVRFAIKQTNSA